MITPYDQLRVVILQAYANPTPTQLELDMLNEAIETLKQRDEATVIAYQMLRSKLEQAEARLDDIEGKIDWRP